MSNLTIEIKGLDKLLNAFEKFPREIARTLSQAGHKALNDVLAEQGLRNYPPYTAANQPPTPYYKRGQGTQYASYNKGESENLGKQWYVKREGYKTRIGNRASYAKYVHGKKLQAKAMERIGWRKLYDVVKEKLPDIQKIYQQMVDRTIRRLGL
jgi:hypothetical protein